MKIFLQILLLVLWLGLAAGAVVLMGFSNRNHEVKACSGLEVKLRDAGPDPLFTAFDLKKQLNDRFGKFEKQLLLDIEIEKIIEFLGKNPSIDYVDAHTTIEGKIVVEVTPCRPLVRLINSMGTSFYLDVNGKLIPANPFYPSRVVVANGEFNIPIKTGKSIFTKKDGKTTAIPNAKSLADIHMIAEMLETDSVLNALIEQIYIKPDGTIRMATKAGSHSVEFGDTSDARQKFENLKIFYKHGLSRTGWQKYKVINLTYKNQVVCTK
ncbi:MAG: hypothetical protein IPH84_12655 [Bacteroidales bacterium]|nr:hypothetical protein [Bacteroidales bacterium]